MFKEIFFKLTLISLVFLKNSYRKINFGAWSHLDSWCQWEPSVPPGRGQWAAGAHHRRREERGTHQPIYQEWCGSLPDQRREEDPQGPGGGVQ